MTSNDLMSRHDMGVMINRLTNKVNRLEFSIARVRDVVEGMQDCRENDGKMCDACLQHLTDLTEALEYGEYDGA